jgi:transglutaminase-like putative cysteine protease
VIRTDLKQFVPSILSGPTRVPDTLSVCDRLAILTEIARIGSQLVEVWAVANSFAGPNQTADILAFVQTLPFLPDPEGEWYQGALYTAFNGGDCEDLVSLLVAMYESVGIKSEIIWLEQRNRPLNHVSCRVLSGGRMQWAEPSIKGARIGENPYDALSRTRDGKAM